MSASQTLTQRVEAMTVERQRVADKLAGAHGDFAYSLGASLIQKEKSGIVTGEATTLDDAASAFEKHIEDTAKELEGLWKDWSRS